jgi:hypothetical protein
MRRDEEGGDRVAHSLPAGTAEGYPSEWLGIGVLLACGG